MLGLDGFANMSYKSTPKAVIARDKILSWIQAGRYSPGQKLPSERSIGDELGLNHITVRQGLKELSKAGLVMKRPRVGNFVAEIRNQHLATRISILFPDYMFSSDPVQREQSHEELQEVIACHPVPGVVISGVFQILSQRKYSIAPLYYKKGRCWLDSGEIAVERDARGIILWPDSTIQPQEIEKMLEKNLKVVLLRNAPQLKPLGLFYVDCDFGMAMSQILDKFLKLGHRKIMIVRYTARPDAEVLDGIVSHHFEAGGIKDFEKYIFNIPNRDSKPDYSILDDIFDLGEDFPTAVVVPDEYTAWELFCRCYRKNIKIPEDLSVASLENSSPHVFPVKLSAPDSITLNLRTAKLAAQKLSSLLNGEELIERCAYLRCDVIFTKSVAAPRTKSLSISLKQ